MSLFELRSDPAPLARRSLRSTASPATRERPAPSGGTTPWRLLIAIAVLAASALAVVNGAVIVNGDGVWHLLWGRALADGTLASFAPGPTPHPSLLVLGAATSLLGDEASYTITYALFGPAAFGALVAAVFEVARRLSSPAAATIAVLVVGTSPEVLAIAGAARYDIAFAALVMSAVALEMAQPRRGVAPLACLAVAGLIRPEAWLLAGLYWLYLAPRLSRTALVQLAVLVALAPLLWSLMDALVMGDPLYSLHVTDEASARLYGQYTPWENLEVAWRNLIRYLGVLPLLLPIAAAPLLIRDRNPIALPLVGVLGITLGTFLLLISQGMASNSRYLLVPVCALGVLTAVTIDGGGRRTRLRVVLGVVLAVLLCLQLAARSDLPAEIRNHATAAAGRYENIRALVGVHGVRQALRDCPRVSAAAGGLRTWFALASGRPPEQFVSGEGGRRPDVFLAPGNQAVADWALTRARFDGDASFRVPPGLRAGPRNDDWILYVSPTSACTAGLR